MTEARQLTKGRTGIESQGCPAVGPELSSLLHIASHRGYEEWALSLLHPHHSGTPSREEDEEKKLSGNGLENVFSLK